MKKLLLLSALLICSFGFGQTPITDANFNQAIQTCLSTNPIDGMCSESEYGAMPDWDVSQVTDMSDAFSNKFSFNADISAWDVSNVTNTEDMFISAYEFNQPIGNWDVSSVTNMQDMFLSAEAFNQPIGNWNVSSVTNMYDMFSYAISFNQPIGNWDVSNVTDMSWMFYEAYDFNQPIGTWDVSSVTDMSYMFSYASAFDQPLNNWDVSSVTDMDDMFNSATSFNQDISNWCVTNITSEPFNFSISSPLTESNKPVWGTCPSSPYEWINYGTQDWTVENAEMVTYRDGTPIPQVTDNTEWANLTTGAWCYYDNDPTKGKLYNWYAVAGIHDNDPNTPNKELAPEGWHVPSDAECFALQSYLIESGYNYDGSTEETSNTNGNKLGKALASKSGWAVSSIVGSPGNNQDLNNSSNFNLIPRGSRRNNGYFQNQGQGGGFWTSSDAGDGNSWKRIVAWDNESFIRGSSTIRRYGFSVRFVRDATSLSITDFSNSIIMYPNPVKNKLTIDGLVVKDVVIYSVLGKAVLNISNQNTIDVSSLSKGVYFIKVSDGINASTKKFIKD